MLLGYMHMGIKTEDFVKNLPPKEITAGVDWLGILDGFDPTVLSDRYINECARRDPYDTCYKWDTPVRSVEERYTDTKTYAGFDRRRLEECVERIESEGLTPVAYKNARQALIRAISRKGAVEYNRREYERLGEVGRKKQAKEYAAWENELEDRRAEEELESLYFWGGCLSVASVHEKIVKIRKGVLGSDGRPLIQRNFAKFIGYPINKYAEAEKVDRYCGKYESESEVEDELLEKLVMICHANPYWLFDCECDADLAEYDPESEYVLMGDCPCVFAAPDIILKWIEEGRPKDTAWSDG